MRTLVICLALIALGWIGAVTAPHPSTQSRPAPSSSRPLPTGVRIVPSRLEIDEPVPQPTRASRSERRTPRRTPRVTRAVSLSGLALRVATCESGDHHGSVNWTATNRHSSASGGFQFLDGTWHSTTGLPGRAKDYPPSVQIKAFWTLYRRAGLRPWAQSKECWS